MNGKPIDFENGTWAARIGGLIDAKTREIEAGHGTGTNFTYHKPHDCFYRMERHQLKDRIDTRNVRTLDFNDGFYYTMRCIPHKINRYLDFFHPPVYPPITEWPCNLFDGMQDEVVNTVLATLDMRGINGGNNLEQYKRIAHERSKPNYTRKQAGVTEPVCQYHMELIDELRGEVKMLSAKIQETELWNALLCIENIIPATRFVSEAEKILADADLEMRKRLTKMALACDKTRLACLLGLMQ